jgi:hypothetical protein
MFSPSSERRTAVTSEENEEDPLSFSGRILRMLTNQKKVGSEKSVMGVCMHGFSHSPGLCPCGFKRQSHQKNPQAINSRQPNPPFQG